MADPVKESWDKNAEAWTAGVESDAPRLLFNEPRFLDFMGRLTGRRVLDAACGEGHLTRQVSAGHVAGIDLSPKLIDIARAAGGADYHVGDITAMTMFADASFDAVVSFMALMDVADLSGALEEFRRVLTPDGDLFIAIRHPCFLAPRFDVVPWRGGERRLAIGGYFLKGPYTGRALATGIMPIPRFQRTLSDYVAALANAGFGIAAIEEPRPSDEACAKLPMLEFWRREAAMFLYIRATR